MNLTDRDGLVDCLECGDPDDEVLVAWQCYRQVRSACAADTAADGKASAEHIVAPFKSCLINEIARLGRALRQREDTYLGYFTTGGANNGGTDATASSSSTGASPAATATPTTTSSACSWSTADY